MNNYDSFYPHTQTIFINNLTKQAVTYYIIICDFNKGLFKKYITNPNGGEGVNRGCENGVRQVGRGQT